MVNRCVVCKKYGPKQFKFPTRDPDRMDKWMQFCKRRREDHKTYYVLCSKHFAPDCFPAHANRSTLLKNAIPTLHGPEEAIGTPSRHEADLFLSKVKETSKPAEPMTPYDMDISVEDHVPTQTTSTEDNDLVILKNKCIALTKRLKRKEAIIKTTREALIEAESLSTNKNFQQIMNASDDRAKCIIDAHFREFYKSNKGRRFSLEEKITSLTLMKQSARVYKTLSTIFGLPSINTLRKLLSKIDISTGVNPIIKNYLKTTTPKLALADRKCIFAFDEMFLTPGLHYNTKGHKIIGLQDLAEGSTAKIADRVLVVVVRGLRRNWKLPLAYYFSDGPTPTAVIVRICKEIVEILNEVGLDVCGFVCDQGTTNVAAVNMLKKQSNEECIKIGRDYEENTIFVHNKLIFPFFDVPHLLKGVRNNLLKGDLYFEMDGCKKQASWNDVIKSYYFDQTRTIRAMPKLTDEHIVPNKIKKMKVKNCTQVFSQRVASFLSIVADYAPNEIGPHGSDTADLINFFDKLFDSLNSSKEFCPGKIYRSAVSEKTDHVKFWIDSIKILETMHFKDNKGNNFVPPSVKNWIPTIKNFIKLWDTLKQEDFQYFCTRRINQDPVENFFAAIRGHGVYNAKPQPMLFINAYKTLLINNFTTSQSLGSNCERECDSLLGDVTLLIKNFLGAVNEQNNNDNEEEDNDEHQLHEETSASTVELIDRNNISYFGGYIIKKINTLQTCEECKRNCVGEPNIEHELVTMREFRGQRDLTYTTTKFNDALDIFTKHLYNVIPKYCTDIKLLYNIERRNYMENLACGQHLYLTQMMTTFITRVLLYAWVKDINNIISGIKDIPPNSEDCIQIMAKEKYLKSRKVKFNK